MFAYLRFARSIAKNIYRVTAVLLWRHVFEVAKSRIPLVSVFVIDLISSWAGAKKGVDYQLMYGHRATLAIFEEANSGIVGSAFQPWTAAREDASNSCSVPAASIAPHSAKARHRIPALVADNWTPFLGWGRLGMHRKLTPFGAMWATVTSGAPTSSIADCNAEVAGA